MREHGWDIHQLAHDDVVCMCIYGCLHGMSMDGWMGRWRCTYVHRQNVAWKIESWIFESIDVVAVKSWT